LFTHAALYIPREMVQAVKNHAHLAAVFILPSGGKLDLDYLDLLNAHWVVDHTTLAHGQARAETAKSILSEGSAVRENIAEIEATPSLRGPSTGRGPGSVAPRSRASRPPPSSGVES